MTYTFQNITFSNGWQYQRPRLVRTSERPGGMGTLTRVISSGFTAAVLAVIASGQHVSTEEEQVALIADYREMCGEKVPNYTDEIDNLSHLQVALLDAITPLSAMLQSQKELDEWHAVVFRYMTQLEQEAEEEGERTGLRPLRKWHSMWTDSLARSLKVKEKQAPKNIWSKSITPKHGAALVAYLREQEQQPDWMAWLVTAFYALRKEHYLKQNLRASDIRAWAVENLTHDFQDENIRLQFTRSYNKVQEGQMMMVEKHLIAIHKILYS